MNSGYHTRGLVLTQPAPNAVELIDRTLPLPGPTEALIRIRCAGICGTDLHIIAWNQWAAGRYRTPLPLGHELCGEVLHATPGCGFAVGDRVSAETHLPCGVCTQCQLGRGHTCENLKTFTSLGLGAFSNHAVIPILLLRRVPDFISDEEAAALEPAGIGFRAAQQALRYGDRVVVSGCGPVGLFAILALRHLGASRIEAIEPSVVRRELAMACGATNALSPDDISTLASTDAVIETSGSPIALRAALTMPRSGGGVVMVGLPSKEPTLDVARHIVLREVVLEGLYGRQLETGWTDLFAAMNDGLDLTTAITSSFPLDDFETALAGAKNASSGKVLLKM